MGDANEARGVLTEEGHLELHVGEEKRWVFWAGSCGDAECECRDIVLYPIAEESVHDEAFAAFDELRLDPDSAVIRDDEGDALDPRAEPFLTALDAALTGSMLDALVRRWHSDKGKTPSEGHREKPIGMEDWTVDELVAYEQVFEPLRMEDFELDGIVYTAMELYVANPADTRAEVIIDFAETSDEEDDEDIPVGDVVVKLGGGLRFEPEEGDDDTLRALWGMYSKRYPTLEHLRERDAIIKATGARLLLRKR